jgi:hypothetical protein
MRISKSWRLTSREVLTNNLGTSGITPSVGITPIDQDDPPKTIYQEAGSAGPGRGISNIL